MLSFANWTRVALIALSSCALGAGELAHADQPAAGAVPPGWVWQGVWQDGRWNGQWVPGPGPGQGAPMPGAYPPPPGAAPWGGDPEMVRIADRCRHDGADFERNHKHHHECELFFRDHPDFAQGYPQTPYPPFAYPQPAYAPVGYVMMPVVITTPQTPCVETRTVTTTTYVTETRRHVVWTRPHRKDKRVYTGS